MPRQPTRNDFPDNVVASVVPSPASDAPTNVLFLLHGLGDSHEAFAQLAQQMNLPDTVCVAVRAPHRLLDLGGFHWGDDIIFDSNDGGIDADGGFKQTKALLNRLVDDVAIGRCGYQTRDVLFLGFGQGGMAALDLAAALEGRELGGVISVGAGLPVEAPASLEPKGRTPILVCAGSVASSAVTPATESKLGHVFQSVTINRYRRPGDTMPKSRDEMLPLMQFFAQRLRSNKGVPAGSVQIA